MIWLPSVIHYHVWSDRCVVLDLGRSDWNDGRQQTWTGIRNDHTFMSEIWVRHINNWYFSTKELLHWTTKKNNSYYEHNWKCRSTLASREFNRFAHFCGTFQQTFWYFDWPLGMSYRVGTLSGRTFVKFFRAFLTRCLFPFKALPRFQASLKMRIVSGLFMC